MINNNHFHLKPICHLNGCGNSADFSIWDKQDIYDVNISCGNCIHKIVLPGHYYVIEPWDTELSDEQRMKLILDQ